MSSSSESSHMLDQDCEAQHLLHRTSSVKGFPYGMKKATAVFAALVLSTGLNIFQGMRSLQNTYVQVNMLEAGRTQFAHLTWNTPRIFEIEDAYDSNNETLRNQAWEAINYDSGSVALSYQYTDLMGLPRAQPFPWNDTKGLYFLSAYHSLHCLKILHSTLTKLRDGHPLDFVFSHALHCLDALRQDVICFADDTPLYSSLEHPGSPGVSQGRQCRSWEKLETYSHEHTSCWRDINPTEPIDTLLRYRYCPPGSPYNERIHEIFGDFNTGDDASATT